MNTLSGILTILGFIPYIIAILRGETVPNPVSWSIWATMDAIALVAMVKQKAKVGQLFGATIGATIVTLLAIIVGKPTMNIIDLVSAIGSTIGIFLWWKTSNPNQGIIWSQCAILVGSIPTIAHGWQNPGQEDPIAWSIWTTSCLCALWVVHKNKKWDLENALQPITFTIIEVVMVLLVVVRPWFL